MNNEKKIISSVLHGRNLPSVMITVIITLSVMLLNMILYVVGTSYPLYLQFEETPDLSISDASDAEFFGAAARGDRVKVTFCMYRDVIENHSTGKYVLDTADEFVERYSDLIELKFINIITQLDSDGNFVDLTPYEQYSETYGTPLSRYSVIFECGNKVKVVTDTYSSAGFADFFTLDASGSATSYNGEETFASMVSYVIEPGEPRAAYITVGHSEQPSSALFNLLVRAGYVVKEINLRKEQKIPDDAGLVVIANPITDFERAAEGSGLHSEIERLREYAERGGNILVTLDPVLSRTAVLESFLAEFGFSIDRTEGESNIVKDVSASISTDGFRITPTVPDEGKGALINDKIDIGGGAVVLNYAASMTLSGSAKPLLISSPAAVAEAGGETVNTDGNYVVAGYAEHTFDNGNSASVAVIPSIYLTAADAVVSEGYANKDFVYAMCEVLFDAGSMSYGTNSYVYNDMMLEGLTMKAARIYTAIIIAVPVLLCAVGVVCVVRRKNR